MRVECCHSSNYSDLFSFFTITYLIHSSWGKSFAFTRDYRCDDTIFLRPSSVSRVTNGSVDESGEPLCSCSVHMNHGLWEGWWRGCTLSRSFIRWGLPFLTVHSSATQPHSYSPDPHGQLQHQVQGGPFKALEELSVYATLCPLPLLPEIDLTWNVAL